MSIDVSKYCADFLRNSALTKSDTQFQASHSRELVAAFFGYKSHASLLADTEFSVNKLHEATILVPDVPMIEKRRADLGDLPVDLPSSKDLASLLGDELNRMEIFTGDIWLYASFENYVMEQLLHEEDGRIMDELSGVMAETNAIFDMLPEYKNATITEDGDETLVEVDGTYEGTNDEDKPFSGDKIDMHVQVRFRRVAGHNAFLSYEIYANGGVNDDGYYDEEQPSPSKRPKDDFLEQTGGFRFGETPQMLQERLKDIAVLRQKIADGQATYEDIEHLSELTSEIPV